jgi:predicted transglutaminase-like cysteine proteinase
MVAAMKSCRPTLGFAAFFLTASLLPASAHASTGAFVVPAVFVSAAFQTQACGAQSSIVMPAARSELGAPASKSAALLGGQMSSLERLTLQQSSATALAPSAQAQPASAQPALFGMGYSGANCLGGAVSGRSPAADPSYAMGDFLASKRLAVRHTSFDPSWNRVQRAALSKGAVPSLSAGASSSAKLAAVNAWANSRIRFVEDSTLYGKADYWASAAETLRARAGDCEDIAILKMQVLAAAGVPRSDMYLTLARDLVRNADHAMLIVKADGRYWLLDNSTDRLLDASESHDYRPIMSFGTSQKWLHGYAETDRADAPPPYRSVIASSNARSTGFSR